MSNPLAKITLLGAIAFITLIFVSTRPQPVQAAGQVPVSARAFPDVAPVKLYGGSNNILRSFAPTITVVNAGPDTDAANNDYRRIQDALNSAASGDTIILNGTFNFTAPFAAAAWALGNDNIASTADDYEVLVPAGLSNVTLTANNLGDATIQGPGDWQASTSRRSWCLIVSISPGLARAGRSRIYRFSTLTSRLACLPAQPPITTTRLSRIV